MSQVGWDPNDFHDYKTLHERDVLVYKMIEEQGTWQPALIGRFVHDHDQQEVRNAAALFLVRLTGKTEPQLEELVDRFIASKERDPGYRTWVETEESRTYYILRGLAAPALQNLVSATYSRAGFDSTPVHLLMEDESWWFLFKGSYVRFSSGTPGNEWILQIDVLDHAAFFSGESPRDDHGMLRDSVWNDLGLRSPPATESAVSDYSCRDRLDLSG